MVSLTQSEQDNFEAITLTPPEAVLVIEMWTRVLGKLPKHEIARAGS